MSPPRKRFCYAIMFLAGVTLFVDRFLLPDGSGVPQTALASGDAGTPAGDRTSIPESIAVTDQPIPELPFPYTVSRFSFDGTARDLFAPPGADTQDEETDKRSAYAERVTVSSRAAFVERHGLGGVLTQKRLKIAIVDGRWMRIGDALDGCTLDAVGGREARFTCEDGEALLIFGRRSSTSGD